MKEPIIVRALLAAKMFVQQELEVRERSYLPDVPKEITEARKVLRLLIMALEDAE